MNLIGKEHYMALTKDQLIADIAELSTRRKPPRVTLWTNWAKSLPISWKTAAKSLCQVSAN
jgi:hypothetical protein